MSASRLFALASALAVAASGCGRDRLFDQETVDGLPIKIQPASLEVAQGQAYSIDVLQVTATGTITVLANPTLTLESDDPEVATIAADGTGAGVAEGTTFVRARLKGRVAVASITVTGAALERVEVTPDSVQTTVDGTTQLQVTGFFDDGTTADLTDASSGTTYTSSATDVVTVGRHPDSDIFLDDVTVSRRHAEAEEEKPSLAPSRRRPVQSDCRYARPSALPAMGGMRCSMPSNPMPVW